MQVEFLLTPSNRINGLPRPIPKAGATAELDDDLATELIRRNIVKPTGKPLRRPKKVKAVPDPPKLAETTEPTISKEE